jgi:uncharacterized membrane protein YeaQ/YmgE (transglycosylase-associated protein family)
VIVVLFVVLLVLFVVLPLAGMVLSSLISAVVVGLVLGGLGRLVVPGRQPIGFFGTVASGLAGSLLGGFVGQRVLRIQHFGVFLLEVAAAALVVAALAGGSRHRALR